MATLRAATDEHLRENADAAGDGRTQLSHSLLDGGEQVVVFLERGQVGVLCLDGIGAAEQEARLAGPDHPQVVMAVARRDGVEAAGLQRAHGGQLRFGAAQRKPAVVPSSATSSSLQNSAGQPSFAMRGWANWVNVSLMMTAWVVARSSFEEVLRPRQMGSMLR